MPSIFLAHNSKDKPFTRRLGKALSDHGIRVWVDEAQIRVGDSLLDKISAGIQEMDYLGVVLSPSSVASNWVHKEVLIAATMEIKHKKVKVLPILYKDCEVPIFLQEKLYADFRTPSKFQKSLIKLLDALLPAGFEEHLLSVVRKSNEAEFSAYKALPRIDLKGIDKYFTATGSARKRIVSLLKRHQKRQWVINNADNPSAFEIFDLCATKVQGDKAYIDTKEYWYLRWYSTKAKEYCFIYNKTNHQRYVLLRDEKGVWRVGANQYPGRSDSDRRT